MEWARKRGLGGTATAEPDNGLPVHFTKRTMAEWIIDPKSGTAKPSVTRSTAVEIETCGRCHARRSQLSEDHRPGKPLLDTHRVALLEPELYHADGQMQGEVYNYGSFLQSKMYHSGVTCGDCHEPHAAALRHPGNATCLQCHDSKKYDASTHHHHKADSAATKCAGCHMPVRTYMVVDPRHDHSFRIPRPDLTVTLGTPNACNDCHGDKTPAWAAEAVERWFGPQRKGHQRFAGALAKGRTFGDGAEQSLIEIARDADTPGIARATALELLQSYPSAASMAVVRQDLTAPDPLVRLAAVEALQGDAATRWRLGSPLLRDPVRTVRMAAGRTLADALPPESPITDRTALADAVREYVDAQQLNADRPEAHANLGTLFAQVGEAKRAEAEYKAAIKLSPAFIPAYVNLADLYKSLGRDADGEQYLKEALTHDASNAAVHHALGLLKVRQKRLPEALDLLQKAAALAPNQPRYAYVHGVALHSTGKVKEGLAVLEQAHQRFPGEREILTALITMHRDQGNVEQAQLYARKLLAQSPEDPQARALVAEMEKAGKP